MVGLYQYRAKITNVVDGDTIDATLDFGFRLQAEVRLRLVGVNTPELHASDPAVRAAAHAAQAATLEWVAGGQPIDWPFHIETAKTDAFGRYLADVYRHLPNGLGVDPVSLSAYLLALGNPPYVP